MSRWVDHLVGSDIVIVIATVVHVSEAIVVLATSAAGGSTPIAALMMVFHWRTLLAAVLLIAAACATLGQWAPVPHGLRIYLLVPQQALLLITMAAAAVEIYLGHYADGVPRSSAFIYCDQAPRLFLAVAYTAAILARVRREN